jgi:hypothetical protein
MQQFILAAIAVLSLGAGTAFAQSYSHAMPPTNHGTVASGD